MLTQLLKDIESALISNQLENSLQNTCSLIKNKAPKYDWVGFYFMNHNTQKLHLGPYCGEPTDHTIIDFGKGICGQVAISGETYIAKDVQSEDNYIACSIDVRSEIVVPLYVDNKLIGQIDIDSKTSNAFDKEDELFLQNVCNMLSKTFGKQLDFKNLNFTY